MPCPSISLFRPLLLIGLMAAGCGLLPSGTQTQTATQAQACDVSTYEPACSNGGYQFCHQDENHGTPYVAFHPCLLGDACMQTASGPTCASSRGSCISVGQRRCAGNRVQSCSKSEKLADDKPLWRMSEICGGEQTCTQDGQRAECIPKTAEPCDTPGATRCDGQKGMLCAPLLGIGEPATVHHWISPQGGWCGPEEICTSGPGRLACMTPAKERCTAGDRPRCHEGRIQGCGVVERLPADQPVYWQWSGGRCGSGAE